MLLTRAAAAAALAFLACGLGDAGGALACPGAAEPCAFPGGTYLALPPPDWDGKAPLPTTIFYHGYNQTAAEFAANADFAGGFAGDGVLLVLPNSNGPGWRERRPDGTSTDPLPFADALRADLLARFPVDRTRLMVSGFSAGAGLTLELACRRGRDYAAFAPVAGSYREPVPASCPTGPVSAFQIHGRADDAIPLTGTDIDEHTRLADVLQSFGVLRQLDGCPEEPQRSEPGPGQGGVCVTWDRCEPSGKALRFCLHDGRHEVPADWPRAAQAWLGTLPR